MRIDFHNMRVRELPQPGQRWKVLGDPCCITSVQVHLAPSNRPQRWMVFWNYIDEDGFIKFRDDPLGGLSKVCDNNMELGRFLHKAERVQ